PAGAFHQDGRLPRQDGVHYLVQGVRRLGFDVADAGPLQVPAELLLFALQQLGALAVDELDDPQQDVVLDEAVHRHQEALAPGQLQRPHQDVEALAVAQLPGQVVPVGVQPGAHLHRRRLARLFLQGRDVRRRGPLVLPLVLPAFILLAARRRPAVVTTQPDGCPGFPWVIAGLPILGPAADTYGQGPGFQAAGLPCFGPETGPAAGGGGPLLVVGHGATPWD